MEKNRYRALHSLMLAVSLSMTGCSDGELSPDDELQGFQTVEACHKAGYAEELCRAADDVARDRDPEDRAVFINESDFRGEFEECLSSHDGQRWYPVAGGFALHLSALPSENADPEPPCPPPEDENTESSCPDTGVSGSASAQPPPAGEQSPSGGGSSTVVIRTNDPASSGGGGYVDSRFSPSGKPFNDSLYRRYKEALTQRLDSVRPLYSLKGGGAESFGYHWKNDQADKEGWVKSKVNQLKASWIQAKDNISKRVYSYKKNYFPRNPSSRYGGSEGTYSGGGLHHK